MFKVGEKIICIDDKSYYNDLTLHKVYIVSECRGIHKLNQSVGLHNMGNIYYSHRFKSVSQSRKEKIKKICSRMGIK